MVTRTGPLTKNADTVALGLFQIRIGASAANIGSVGVVLNSTNSIGALASTKFTGNKEYWELYSGFPQLKDKSLPIKEDAMVECEFKELQPFNLALSLGKDPVTDSYSETVSGEIFLGALNAPAYVRMEAVYTYPDGTSTCSIIFPRAQVTSNTEMDFQEADNVNVPITFTSNRADSGISGGNAAWDEKPLGHILFASS